MLLVGGYFPQKVLEALCAQVDLGIHDVAGRRALTKPILEVSRLLGPLGAAEAAAFLPISARLLGQKSLLAVPAAKT